MKLSIPLMLLALPAFAEPLKVGQCLASPAIPAVVLKVSAIGETTISFQSNLTGAIAVPYNKKLLLEELKTGITQVIGCDQFVPPTSSSQPWPQPTGSDLFGIDLRMPYKIFAEKYKASIVSCADAKHYKLYGISDMRMDSDPNAFVPIKSCQMKDKIRIKFSQPTLQSDFLPHFLVKSVDEPNLLEEVVVEKLEKKFAFKFQEALGKKSLKVADGYVNFYFRSEKSAGQTKAIETILWERSPSLNSMVDDRIKLNQRLKESQEIEKSKKENEGFSI